MRDDVRSGAVEEEAVTESSFPPLAQFNVRGLSRLVNRGLSLLVSRGLSSVRFGERGALSPISSNPKAVGFAVGDLGELLGDETGLPEVAAAVVLLRNSRLGEFTGDDGGVWSSAAAERVGLGDGVEYLRLVPKDEKSPRGVVSLLVLHIHQKCQELSKQTTKKGREPWTAAATVASRTASHVTAT